MSILSDRQIEELCINPPDQALNVNTPAMIEPFVNASVREVLLMGEIPSGGFLIRKPMGSRKILSYGLSSFGYDVRLADEFKLFTNLNSTVVDPKKIDNQCLIDAEVKTDTDGAKYVILPPNSYILGRTMEYFTIPRDVMIVCVGKSTYARAGAIVNVTPIEPGFEGAVVIEISNATNLPLKIYAEEGCAQFLFFRGSEECRVSYADRSGKYQGQTGVTLPTV
jgi:dCTP deaminase